MANRERGYVKIELDRPRRLLFDVNAIAELEDLTGQSLSQILDTSTSLQSYSFLRKLVWAGLIHEDKSLVRDPREGVRQVGKWIEEAPGDNLADRMKRISDAIAQAFQTAFGVDAEKNLASPVQPGTNGDLPGTGTRQSASPTVLSG